MSVRSFRVCCVLFCVLQVLLPRWGSRATPMRGHVLLFAAIHGGWWLLELDLGMDWQISSVWSLIWGISGIFSSPLCSRHSDGHEGWVRQRAGFRQSGLSIFSPVFPAELRCLLKRFSDRWAVSMAPVTFLVERRPCAAAASTVRSFSTSWLVARKEALHLWLRFHFFLLRSAALLKTKWWKPCGPKWLVPGHGRVTSALECVGPDCILVSQAGVLLAFVRDRFVISFSLRSFSELCTFPAE